MQRSSPDKNGGLPQWLTIVAVLLYMAGAVLGLFGISRLSTILALSAIGLVTVNIYVRERAQRTP